MKRSIKQGGAFKGKIRDLYVKGIIKIDDGADQVRKAFNNYFSHFTEKQFCTTYCRIKEEFRKSQTSYNMWQEVTLYSKI